MIKTNRESVDAVYVPPEKFNLVKAKPGEFTVREEAGRKMLKAVLPGGHYGSCPVDGDGWSWNGSLDKPTLNPSVRVSTTHPEQGEVELWHGWLREGRWVSC